MRRVIGNGIGLLCAALLLGGCGGDEEVTAPPKPAISVFDYKAPADPAETAPADRRSTGEAPSVLSIAFEPVEPESRERMTAVARVSGDYTALQYVWRLNGERFGANTAEVVLPTMRTGDEISVRVTPMLDLEAGEALEASNLVRNQRPLLSNLSIEVAEDEAAEPFAGEVWRAAVAGTDPDGDSLDFEYRWIVNGERTEVESEFYPVAELARGDRISVRVRAYDGRAWSVPVTSGEIVIGNSAPMIVSVPPRPGPTGFFRYRVDVKDSGGHKNLLYSLRTSPEGMKINALNGEITWQPQPDQAGRHDVEVVVTDSDGGEGTQAFSLALIATPESTSPPAAAR